MFITSQLVFTRVERWPMFYSIFSLSLKLRYDLFLEEIIIS